MHRILRDKLLKTSRFKAFFCVVLARLGKRMPRKLWCKIHSPIPENIRGNSLHESLSQKSKLISLPDSYTIDSSLKSAKSPLTIFVNAQGENQRSPFHLDNVRIFPDGIILADGKINRFSSLFSEISLEKICEVSRSANSHEATVSLDAATFFPRQYVKHGTYGDYVMEFLLPFCNAEIDRSIPLLIDADYIQKHAEADLKALKIPNSMMIPPGGMNVGRLFIPPCCQVFDNFSLGNIENVARLFPLNDSTDTLFPEKVYLSRVGFPSRTTDKQYRVICNEPEVERHLTEAGYLVIRAHEHTNQDIRRLLKNAKIIVANHGAAMFHMMWSRPRCVIELASERWWNQCFIKLGYAIGVEKYHVLKSRDGLIDLEILSSLI